MARVRALEHIGPCPRDGMCRSCWAGRVFGVQVRALAMAELAAARVQSAYLLLALRATRSVSHPSAEQACLGSRHLLRTFEPALASATNKASAGIRQRMGGGRQILVLRAVCGVGRGAKGWRRSICRLAVQMPRGRKECCGYYASFLATGRRNLSRQPARVLRITNAFGIGREACGTFQWQRPMAGLC